MTSFELLQMVGYMLLVLLAVKPLGTYMARVFQREPTLLDPVFGRAERFIYRIAGVSPEEEMDWKANAGAMILFNLVIFVAVYALQRLQGMLLTICRQGCLLSWHTVEYMQRPPPLLPV